MPHAEDLTQFTHAIEATPRQPADILDDMTDWIEQLMQLALSALGFACSTTTAATISTPTALSAI